VARRHRHVDRPPRREMGGKEVIYLEPRLGVQRKEQGKGKGNRRKTAPSSKKESKARGISRPGKAEAVGEKSLRNTGVSLNGLRVPDEGTE